MDLKLFLFVSFSDWRFAISNKVFEWINPSDSRDIWNCECQIIIDGLTPYKTHVLYITRISICGCHRTHSTQTNEATAMGNVKVDYDFQLEKNEERNDLLWFQSYQTKFHKSCLFICYCFFIRNSLLGSKVHENWRMVSIKAFLLHVVVMSSTTTLGKPENHKRIPMLIRAWYFNFL